MGDPETEEPEKRMSFALVFIRECWPIIVAFVVGLLLGARGCDRPDPEVITIEKLVPEVEYVERWKKDTVRHVSREVSVRFDTITLQKIERVLDTMLLIDTVSIVETWLSEQLNYDTIARFKDSSVRISWSNYQNRSEGLRIALSSPPERLRVGIFARGGIRTDFQGMNKPVVGGGIMVFKKRYIIGVEYGYSTNHQITGLLGYRL